ncbi:MAG: transglutaminase domain-containing protein, partial [Dehalococcoidia bacterium]|nr:transglutaminase domain-containing protein [Dehalococcoidia bacterium]
MPLRKMLLPSLLVITIVICVPSLTNASPSEQFYTRGRHIYDDWGISRTKSAGADGFLALTSLGFDPVITRESLGENIDVAWQLGEAFARKYPDRKQRAEQIFYFVRDRIDYISDADLFGMGEFAQNADEVAEIIADEGKAQGDCEDSAILLAVMYKAAGYRSAMVLMPGHVATLVFLPEHR